MTCDEFEHFAREQRVMLFDIGRRFFGNDDDADDVAQEALLRLWMVRERVDMKTNVVGLAKKMARNYCISRWRQRNHLVTEELNEEIVRSENVTPQTILEESENGILLQRAMSHLQPAYRRLFLIKQEAAMDVSQMSAITGMAPHTIETMLSRARKQLYEELIKRKGNEGTTH